MNEYEHWDHKRTHTPKVTAIKKPTYEPIQMEIADVHTVLGENAPKKHTQTHNNGRISSEFTFVVVLVHKNVNVWN